jgi:hypothetical protein
MLIVAARKGFGYGASAHHEAEFNVA